MLLPGHKLYNNFPSFLAKIRICKSNHLFFITYKSGLLATVIIRKSPKTPSSDHPPAQRGKCPNTDRQKCLLSPGGRGVKIPGKGLPASDIRGPLAQLPPGIQERRPQPRDLPARRAQVRLQLQLPLPQMLHLPLKIFFIISINFV